MRALCLALALAACASSSGRTPAELLAGCWVSGPHDSETRLRWTNDVATGFAGNLIEPLEDGGIAARAFSLQPGPGGWTLCEAGRVSNACWAVAEARSGSLEGGRAFVDRYRDRLQFVVVGADGRDLIRFEGVAEPCPAGLPIVG